MDLDAYKATLRRAAAPSVNGHWLYFTGIVIVALGCLYFGFTASVQDPLHLYEGLLILVLATWPALRWAKQAGNHFPLFEVVMLTTANTYAMPILSSHEQLRMYDINTISLSGEAVILYQLLAIASHSLLRGRPGRSAFFTHEVIARELNRYIGYALVLTTVYTFVATFMDVIPNDLVGVFRACFGGIGIVSAFVQARRWGLGELAWGDRVFFVANLVVQLIIQFSTLFLVGGISLLVLAIVGYVSGSKRLPLVAVVLATLVVGLLHTGKSAMRAQYWDNTGFRRQATPSELPAFFAEWISESLEENQATGNRTRMTTSLIERTSLFHMLCLVTSRTPDPLPFLGGKTYGDIPGQLVPRFFWPDKPPGHVSTSTLSIYYGLQQQEDTVKTTIGFGLLAEAYANYGLFGVGLLGCFFGALYKKVETLCLRSPLLSYAGLFQIVLVAWSFQTEFPMSMWLSSMSQATIAVLGVPFIVRNFLG
jgi:hypothetical protein